MMLLGWFHICSFEIIYKDSDKREENKINLFIFYPEHSYLGDLSQRYCDKRGENRIYLFIFYPERGDLGLQPLLRVSEGSVVSTRATPSESNLSETKDSESNGEQITKKHICFYTEKLGENRLCLLKKIGLFFFSVIL